MSEPTRIAGQLRRVHQGAAWHGPALAELLADVDASRALRRPLPAAHNIWELVLHVTVWSTAALDTLAGGKMPDLSPEQDWPRPGETGSQWRDTLGQLDRVQGRLVECAAQFPEERLRELVPGREYSFYHLLHGIAQHNAYHAGQIALLKR